MLNDLKQGRLKHAQTVFTKVTINVTTVISAIDNFFGKLTIKAGGNILIRLLTRLQ